MEAAEVEIQRQESLFPSFLVCGERPVAWRCRYLCMQAMRALI